MNLNWSFSDATRCLKSLPEKFLLLNPVSGVKGRVRYLVSVRPVLKGTVVKLNNFSLIEDAKGESYLVLGLEEEVNLFRMNKKFSKMSETR